MSFEMKYNKNGDPITPKPDVAVVNKTEEVNPASIETVARPALPVEERIPSAQEILEIPKQEDIALEPVVTAEAAPEETVSKSPKAPKQSWRDLRDETLRLSNERDEALRLVQELKSEQSKVVRTPIITHDEDAITIGDTDIAEGRHLKKLEKEITDLRKELKNFHQQTSEITAEQRILQKYPDFYKVVSQDNAKLLRELEPEIAASISQNHDVYLQSIAAYKAIKQFGIHQEDTYEEDRSKALKNAAKPRPLTSISPQQAESPLSHANAFANGLTEDLKSQLLKEMADARRNR